MLEHNSTYVPRSIVTGCRRKGTGRMYESSALPRNVMQGVLVVALLLIAAGRLPAQGNAMKGGDSLKPERGAALIFGERHALTVRAPERWVLDTRSGSAQGLQAVFYPQGESWSRSPAVMYCQVVMRSSEIGDAGAMIRHDEQRYRGSSPTAVVAEGDSIALGTGMRIPTRTFSGGAAGTFEQVAYIEARTVVVLMVLSCRNRAALDSSRQAFAQLVRSYRFLAYDAENIQRAVEAAEEFGR